MVLEVVFCRPLEISVFAPRKSYAFCCATLRKPYAFCCATPGVPTLKPKDEKDTKLNPKNSEHEFLQRTRERNEREGERERERERERDERAGREKRERAQDGPEIASR